ncbi:ABC transporter permease [Lederbergia lenta]|uniref:Binding-protein-dependent transport system inner membrane protein n=1 Tax=Lederbergia lenta TaxID=1467 RepID=A0A2X4WFS4_LEDLE|nr:iron ABC transporter permease [Lederbergia lenta]MCM3111761.1 iron ABC transporter permease [Lederbergia lenta]MEC2322915.1 iron ABC transporter permease [Lederbergia lenta]SQI62031.1 binding-protein-dependent transport system inner membrane protein [Lederbergia lenta]
MIPKQISVEEITEVRRPLSSSFLNKRIISLFGFLLLILLFLTPVFRLVFISFRQEDTFTLAHYAHVLYDKTTWLTVKNTLIIVTGSTILSLFLGVAFAWAMAYVNIKNKKWIQLFIFFPFIIPSYITTLAWVQLFSKNGFVHAGLQLLSSHFTAPNLYSIGGIIFVLGISHYPLVYLLTVNVFRKIPRELEQAAKVSGASRWHILFKLVIPLAIPGITAGGFLAFLSNLDNFGIPAFLGIPANIRVLSTYIYEQIVSFGPSAFSRAAVLSIVLAIIAAAGMIAQWLMMRKGKITETATTDMEARILLSTAKRRICETFIWCFLLFTSIIPFISMAASSFIKAYGLSFRWENLSLKNYQYVLFSDQRTFSAINTSIKLALITAIVCLFVGTAIAYIRHKSQSNITKLMEGIVTVPYALPGTIFALSMILTWMQPIPGWNPGIYGSIWILVIAYLTRFLILQVRSSFTAFSQIDPSIEEAARTSGASGIAKWRKILFPLLFPGLISGALLVFLTALTELTVSSLLWSSGQETIGVVIFNFEQSGYTTYSSALSSMIVMAIFIGGILFIQLEKTWARSVLKKR